MPPKIFQQATNVLDKAADVSEKFLGFGAKAIIGYPVRAISSFGIQATKAAVELSTGKKLPEGGLKVPESVQPFLGKEDIKPWNEDALHAIKTASNITGQEGRVTPSAIIMGTTFAGGMSVLDVLPPTPSKGAGRKAAKLATKNLKSTVSNLVLSRYSEISEGLLDSKAFTAGVKQRFTGAERELIPFMKEKFTAKSIKTLSKDAQQIIMNNGGEFPEYLRPIAQEVRDYMDEGFEFLKKEIDLNYVEDYFNRVWRVPRGSKVFKGRSLETISDGIEKGLTPRTTDVADLVSIYDNFKVRVVANKKFANALSEMTTDAGEAVLKSSSGKSVFHGTSIKSAKIIKESGVKPGTPSITTEFGEKLGNEFGFSVSPNKKFASEFGEEVLEFNISSNAKIATPENLKGSKKLFTKFEDGNVLFNQGDVVKMAKEQGFDVVDLQKFESLTTQPNRISELQVLNENVIKLKGQGQKILQAVDEAPFDYKVIKNPSLVKNTALKGEAAVHPDIFKEVNAVMEQPFNNKGLRSFQIINAFAKKGTLAFSFFHHFSLTESAFQAGIGKKAIKMWNPLEVYNAIKKGGAGAPILQKSELARDGLKHGLSLDTSSDVQRGVVQNYLKDIELRTRAMPIVGKGVKAVRKTNDIWDAALWDYYHTGLKMHAYETNVMRMAKKFPNKDMSIVKKEVAGFVNDSFGGQAWELLKVSKQTQQMAHWAFLAPDWTLSVIRQAGSAFSLGAKNDKQIRAALGQKYWLRAALYFGITANLANYTTSKILDGKGRFLWENEPGNQLNIYAGRNDEGKRNYVKLFKQNREVMEWLTDPTRILGAKVSPMTQAIVEQLSGNSTTQFPTTFKGQEFFDSLPERAKSVGGKFVPITFGSNQFANALPTRTGLTNFRAVGLMEEAIKDKDTDQLKSLFNFALENNLDAKKLMTQAKSNIKSEGTREAKKEAKKIMKKHEITSVSDFNKLRLQLKSDEETTPVIEKQIMDLLRQQLRIEGQKKVFLKE